MTSTIRQTSEPWIDWGKAIASQLIIWHHLTFYGPMVDAANTLAENLFAWLESDARMAVQIFLVMGGYLGARSLLAHPGQAARPASWLSLMLERYRRLMLPGAIALGLAILAAAITRQLIADPDTPATPTLPQLLSNLLLLHDWLGHEALSAGLWYVAIDWQLFACLAALACWLRRSQFSAQRKQWLAVGSVVLATTASLLWINRQPEWDMAAPYFFATYGLGVLAYWLRHALAPMRHVGTLALACLVTLALWVQWRDRVLLAALVSLALVFQPAATLLARSALHPLMRWLAGISYPVFLLHYGVCMVCGAVVSRLWPEDAWLNLLGMGAAWSLSLLAGWFLARHLPGAVKPVGPVAATAPR